MQSLFTSKIAFIGAGSMSEAVIRGLLYQEKAKAQHLFAINRSSTAKCDSLRERHGIHATCDRAEAEQWIRGADIVVLGMKPKDAADALLGYRSMLSRDQLIISVIAGLPFATIERLIGPDIPLVRTMPNTSSHIGLGATGISFTPSVGPEQQAIALDMFAAIGETAVVEEALLDIVTGVSGSGPAYIYYMMEAMIEAGVRGGLTVELARKLTVQTVLGAATMVKQTESEPAELRKKVTSPNGTTQAALETLDRYQFAEAVQAAVLRAAERAGEMGGMIDRETAAKL